MMHLVAEDDPGLVILPLHRLISGVSPEAVGQLVDSLHGTFEIEQHAGEPLEATLAELRARGARGQAMALIPAEY